MRVARLMEGVGQGAERGLSPELGGMFRGPGEEKEDRERGQRIKASKKA